MQAYTFLTDWIESNIKLSLQIELSINGAESQTIDNEDNIWLDNDATITFCVDAPGLLNLMYAALMKNQNRSFSVFNGFIIL